MRWTSVPYAAFVAAAFMLLSSTGVEAQQQIPGANSLISANAGSPVVDVDSDGNIWIVWDENAVVDGIDIAGATSVDGGETFVTTVVGVGDTGDVGAYQESVPDIAAPTTDKAFIIWSDLRDPATGLGWMPSVWGNRLSNFVNHWVSDYPVSHDMAQGYALLYPSVAAWEIEGSSHIYVVWSDDRTGLGDHNIYLGQSLDDGISFFVQAGIDIRVDDSAGVSLQSRPRIAIRPIVGTDVPQIYILWQDSRNASGTRLSDIYYTEGDDEDVPLNGIQYDELLAPNVQVNDDLTPLGVYYTAHQPSIAADSSGNVYAAWADNRNGTTDFDIYFSRKAEGANQFSADAKVNHDTGTAEQSYPDIAVHPETGDIHVVWTDTRNGDADIYLSKSTNGGASFGADVRIDVRDTVGVRSRAVQTKPRVAVDTSGNAYIVWQDSRSGQAGVYFVRLSSHDDGFMPDAPTGLVATAGIEAVDVEWSANLETDLTGYNLYRRVAASDGGDGAEDLSLADYELISEGLSDTWYHDEEVSVGSSYGYIISVTDVAGNEKPSDETVSGEVEQSGAGGGGGGCFMSACASGSPLGGPGW